MPAALPATSSHLYPLGTTVNDEGHLVIGGCDALELAREYGTPAYVVAENDLRARARGFIDGLEVDHPRCAVLFASKAFPCTAVGRVLCEERLGCDVASGGELYLALKAGFPPDEIVMHGNAKSRAEIDMALEAGVGYIVLDSDDDLERVAARADGRTRKQAVLLRVTPDVAGDTHHAISTGQADSKFGLRPDQARAAIERLDGHRSLQLAGLHCHIGSQLLELSPFRAAIESLAALAGDLPVINIGGGLGVAYTSEQHAPADLYYLDVVVRAVHEFLGSERLLMLEPGRALVARSTVTLYTVETVKHNVSRWVAIDGGMSDNLRPMLYGARYEAVIADRPLAAATDRYHLAGKHCESGDVLIRDVALPDPVPGDVVAVPVTGAYGYSLANNYNGVPRPPVILCAGGDARVVVRREMYEDLAARDVDGPA